MARDFSMIKTNVGQCIQDTSTAMNGIIGRFVNRRYFQVLRSVNWEYLNEDYIQVTVAGTQDYNLPSDFHKELYVTDTTNNTNLKRLDFESLVRDHSSELSTSGYPERYVIFKSDDGNQKIRFHYIPNGAYTVAIPYIVKPTALSADTDKPVIDIEDLLEIGAEADAWRYKRQFQKATQTEMLFNNYLADFIWDKENQPNDPTQFKPVTFNKTELY